MNHHVGTFRGYGLGGVFRRLFRAALPFLVRGGKVVGKEALVTGTKVINDVLSGKDLETAAKSRSKEAGKSLALKAINRVQSMIGQGDHPNVKSELELFHLPATQTAIEDGHWVEFHPLSNVFDGGPVEFHISGSGEEYVDLSQTQLYVKAKIVKADGKPLEKDEKIGPVNLFMHSLFSQMDISLNDRLVSNSRHAKALENGTAKYPLNRVLCKVYSVPQGSMSFVQDNIFVGQMPKRIIVGCVDNDAFHDESSEPGSHWLAFYCENGCIEFFDSFGNPPDFYDPRFHEITLRYPSVCWNSTPLQNLTSNVISSGRSQPLSVTQWRTRSGSQYAALSISEKHFMLKSTLNLLDSKDNACHELTTKRQKRKERMQSFDANIGINTVAVPRGRESNVYVRAVLSLDERISENVHKPPNGGGKN
ncbi:uncharacterized protein F54H12.2 [Caerostris extrusa]|uniref:Uncharacterized protein F54H12.2 n=1 Tax=Caerostris extrusa TaxID=172846 RepID=A0AAV4MHN1_CAEEX|nr:uncharacterized protein F54H12.2 [Caerostris extrusa]